MLFGPASRGPVLPATYNDVPAIIARQRAAERNQALKNFLVKMRRYGLLSQVGVGLAGTIADKFTGGKDTTPVLGPKGEPNTPVKKRKKTTDGSGSNKRLRYDSDENDLPGEVGGTSKKAMPGASGKKRRVPDFEQSFSGPNRAGDASHGEEVPVMPIDNTFNKIIPNHYTVQLPHELLIPTLNPALYTYTNSVEMIRLRLNSIYDPIVGATSNTQPQGRDLWAAYFKYYRVLACDVTVTLTSRLPHIDDQRNTKHRFIWGYEVCDQDQSICGNMPGFLVSKHAKRDMLETAPSTYIYDATGSAASVHTTGTSKQTLSFHYEPNKWQYHVREQGSEERWTPIKQNPAVDHDLVFRAFHMDESSTPTSGNAFSLMLSVNYVVQFMEEEESNYKVRDTSVATYGGAGEDATDN